MISITLQNKLKLKYEKVSRKVLNSCISKVRDKVCKKLSFEKVFQNKECMLCFNRYFKKNIVLLLANEGINVRILLHMVAKKPGIWQIKLKKL